MINDSAAVVMFAIRSSIKLGTQLRRAYVDCTKDRGLVLPLPNFNGAPDLASAINYFSAKPGLSYLEKTPRLAELIHKWGVLKEDLTPEEEIEALTFYDEFFNLDAAQSGALKVEGGALSGKEFEVLVTVRQWKRGSSPNPSTLQRVAGAFIEIGVDYFANVPGGLHENSRYGKAVSGFLEAMSEIQFSEAQLGSIPGRLFVAALDTIFENKELLSGDPKIQELVRVVTKSVSSDVARHIAALGDGDLTKQERIGDLAESVFRSVLSSAADLALSDPQRYLGVSGDGEGALVTQVGNAMLGLLVDDSGVKFDQLFSRDGIEKVTRSALVVIGEHPEILIDSKNEGLKKLLSGIAADLSQFDTLLTPGILPELTRMILEKTGENLPLLWPDLAKKPEHNLLLTAAETTLATLSKKPAAAGQWKFKFSSKDLLTVVNVVFDEFAENPAWLVDDAGKINGNLRLALEGVIDVIRKRADNRLSSALAADIVSAVISKVGLRKEFLDVLPAGTSAQGKTLIAAVLDALLANLFDPQLDARAAWQWVRQDAIKELLAISLDTLSKVKLGGDKLTAYVQFLKEQIGAIANGAAFDSRKFATTLQAVLFS